MTHSIQLAHPHCGCVPQGEEAGLPLKGMWTHVAMMSILFGTLTWMAHNPIQLKPLPLLIVSVTAIFCITTSWFFVWFLNRTELGKNCKRKVLCGSLFCLFIVVSPLGMGLAKAGQNAMDHSGAVPFNVSPPQTNNGPDPNQTLAEINLLVKETLGKLGQLKTNDFQGKAKLAKSLQLAKDNLSSTMDSPGVIRSVEIQSIQDSLTDVFMGLRRLHTSTPVLKEEILNNIENKIQRLETIRTEVDELYQKVKHEGKVVDKTADEVRSIRDSFEQELETTLGKHLESVRREHDRQWWLTTFALGLLTLAATLCLRKANIWREKTKEEFNKGKNLTEKVEELKADDEKRAEDFCVLRQQTESVFTDIKKTFAAVDLCELLSKIGVLSRDMKTLDQNQTDTSALIDILAKELAKVSSDFSRQDENLATALLIIYKQAEELADAKKIIAAQSDELDDTKKEIAFMGEILADIRKDVRTLFYTYGGIMRYSVEVAESLSDIEQKFGLNLSENKTPKKGTPIRKGMKVHHSAIMKTSVGNSFFMKMENGSTKPLKLRHPGLLVPDYDEGNEPEN